jgi:hypothetical protein
MEKSGSYRVVYEIEEEIMIYPKVDDMLPKTLDIRLLSSSYGEGQEIRKEFAYRYN